MEKNDHNDEFDSNDYVKSADQNYRGTGNGKNEAPKNIKLVKKFLGMVNFREIFDLG